MTKFPLTTRTITHAEARDVARRLIAGSFRRDGERLRYDNDPRFSIPAEVDRDDDLLMLAYIEQREAADLVGAHEDEEALSLPRELPDDIAQEAGQFYEQYAVVRPGIRKAEAMRHAWREVIRPRVRRLEAMS